MMLRRLLISSACLITFVTTARACPDHGGKAALQLQSRTAAAAALVAWKPRAWMPPAAATRHGLQVSIDPVDGTLGMPAPGELSAFSTVGEEDMRPVSFMRRANGSARAQLDERWESHAVASIGPDGKLRWTCVEGKQGAERFMKNPVLSVPAPVSSAPVWEEK